MSFLILVRHGQSIWNLEKRFTGWVDIDLTENGKIEAEKAGKLITLSCFVRGWLVILVKHMFYFENVNVYILHENSDDEDKVKAETKATLRCYVLDEEKTDKAVNNENTQGKLAIFSKAY